MARFLNWWLHELSGLLPAGLRRWWNGTQGMVSVRFDGKNAFFAHEVDGQLAEIFSIDLATGNPDDHRREIHHSLLQVVKAGVPVVLMLPEDRVLRRTIRLPLAVEENLRQVIGFELDRFTPFKSEQAYYDFRVVDTDSTQKEIAIDLHVANRTFVDSLIQVAKDLGLRITSVAPLEKVFASGSSLNLLPDSLRNSEKPRRFHWWRILFFFTALFLLVGLLSIPIWKKRSAAIDLLLPLANEKAAAHETDGLRDKLNRLVEEHNRLLDRKWSAASTLIILEDLSRRLNDDTYVTEFTFDSKTIEIRGESASAANLIELLENSSVFKEVSFKSPLTKLSGTTIDRFHIGATLENDAKPKSPTPASNGNPSIPAQSPTLPTDNISVTRHLKSTPRKVVYKIRRSEQ